MYAVTTYQGVFVFAMMKLERCCFRQFHCSAAVVTIG